MILPWMGRFLAFQSLIRLFVFPWTLSKLGSIDLSLLSMSIPSSVKESFHLSGISGHKMSWALKFELKGTTLVLSKFACNPDILLKVLINLTQAFSDDTHCSRRIFRVRWPPARGGQLFLVEIISPNQS